MHTAAVEGLLLAGSRTGEGSGARLPAKSDQRHISQRVNRRASFAGSAPSASQHSLRVGRARLRAVGNAKLRMIDACGSTTATGARSSGWKRRSFAAAVISRLCGGQTISDTAMTTVGALPTCGGAENVGQPSGCKGRNRWAHHYLIAESS